MGYNRKARFINEGKSENLTYILISYNIYQIEME